MADQKELSLPDVRLPRITSEKVRLATELLSRATSLGVVSEFYSPRRSPIRTRLVFMAAPISARALPMNSFSFASSTLSLGWFMVVERTRCMRNCAHRTYRREAWSRVKRTSGGQPAAEASADHRRWFSPAVIRTLRLRIGRSARQSRALCCCFVSGLLRKP